LNYLIITCYAISFVVNFLTPCLGCWNADIHIPKYVEGGLGKGLLYELNNHTQGSQTREFT